MKTTENIFKISNKIFTTFYNILIGYESSVENIILTRFSLYENVVL